MIGRSGYMNLRGSSKKVRTVKRVEVKHRPAHTSNHTWEWRGRKGKKGWEGEGEEREGKERGWEGKRDERE